MNLKSLVSPQYLFQVNTAFVSPQEKVFFLAGATLVLVAIVCKISAILAPTPTDSKFRNKFYRLFLTIGIAEIVWYLCRYENVSYFDVPFVAWLILLLGLIWLVSVLVNFFGNYKKEKMVWEKEQVRLRYLPK